jgi:SAM-dependent methyltransferase
MPTSATPAEYSQLTMVHPLPVAPLVDRVEHLVALARGRRVVHVGFVDAGCQSAQRQAGTWLHEHLARVSSGLVGIDLDEQGVADARAAGHEAHVVDCTDPVALATAAVAPAQLVIAGEVIEHLDSPGGFLEGMHALVAPNGLLVVTTPNAYGLLNVLASLLHREINHPDHVCMFTWRTLTNLAARHGWQVESTAVYVPSVKQVGGRGTKARAMAAAAQGACALERLSCRLGRAYTADGIIVTFRSTR